MKKIVFHINYLLAGGIEKVLIELLRALDARKYEIVLSVGYKLDELEILKQEIPPHVKIEYLLEQPVLTQLKKKKIQKQLSIGGKLTEEVILPYFKKSTTKKRLLEVLKGADVLVDFDMTLSPYYDMIKEVKKAAYCHFSLRHYWNGNRRKLDKLAERLMHYDKVVMLCDEMKEDAAQLYPQLAPKLVRIYNALNADAIIAQAKERVDVEDNYFVSAGRLDETQKDFSTLIRGYAAYVRKYDGKEKLVIVGDGPSRQTLEQLAATEQVQERVVFAGYQNNPYKWMQHAELFLFCTKYEGLPTVLIEAQILRKPIIATKAPTGIKELLMQGEAGLLIALGDASALCEAIHQLNGNSRLQKKFSEDAATLVREFDIKKMVSHFEEEILN